MPELVLLVCMLVIMSMPAPNQNIVVPPAAAAAGDEQVSCLHDPSEAPLRSFLHHVYISAPSFSPVK